MGVSRQLFKYYLDMHSRMVLSGDIPDIQLNENVPDPMQISGVSYLVKPGEDKPLLQWVKTKVKTQPDAVDVREMIEMMLTYRSPLVHPPPLETEDKLLTQYTITDLHVGMYSWAEETGADWDLNICSETVLTAMRDLITRAPSSTQAILVQNGDFFHYDSMHPVTPTNGHQLSSDGRFLKMYRTGVQIMIESIRMLLEKHQRVKLINTRGNHDLVLAQVLGETIRATFQNEVRLTVLNSPNPFNAIDFGKVFIGTHHGDLKGFKNLPAHFADNFSKLWGRTKYRYIHTGHKHQLKIEDAKGVTLYQHPTIAAPDDYASHRFDQTKREMAAITYHRDYGIYSTVNHTAWSKRNDT
jgi:hypothetical protein